MQTLTKPKVQGLPNFGHIANDDKDTLAALLIVLLDDRYKPNDVYVEADALTFLEERELFRSLDDRVKGMVLVKLIEKLNKGVA